MFCPRCGYKNDDSATYCTQCGTALNANNNANSYSTTNSRPPRPENYLVWAILCTIFCCLPLGIASIVFSTEVNSKYERGDYQGARESSRKAKNWAMWGAISWTISIMLYVIFYGMIGIAALSL